jgi:16S rRNA (cytosine1402-N4)-methyltransferase
MANGYHTPVLPAEVLEYLLTSRSGTYIDGTVGGGGHAERIIECLSPEGRLIGFDVDEDAIQEACRRLEKHLPRVDLVRANFAQVQSQLKPLGVEHVHGVLFDLGVSSHQLDAAGRGFSFERCERLDMRMDQRHALDAVSLLGRLDEKALADVIWKYGEERHARAIARKIAQVRAKQPIEMVEQLVSVVRDVVGQRYLRKSLARVFQALRIVLNNELENLQRGLEEAVDFLLPGGRIVVISYHSLEDRIVKEFFRAESAERISSGSKLIQDKVKTPRLRVLTKKPIQPAESEIRRNRRARSAKLRAAEKT